MVEMTGMLARRLLRLSESAFQILHRVAVEHRESDVPSRLKTKGERKTLLDDVVPVLTTSQEIFACAPRTDVTNYEFIKKLKGQFIPFIPDVCMTAGITQNKKVEIPTLAEFISEHSTDDDCHSLFAPMGKPSTVSTVRQEVPT